MEKSARTDWNFGTQASSFTGLNLAATSTQSSGTSNLLQMLFTDSSTGGGIRLINVEVGGAAAFRLNANGNLTLGDTMNSDVLISPTHTTASRDALKVKPVWNYSSNHIALLIDPTDTLSNDQALLFKANLGTVNRFQIRKDGQVTVVPVLITSAQKGLNLIPTFNNNSTHTAFHINVTDTLSGDGSQLAEWNVGGTKRFEMIKDGRTVVTPNITSSAQIGLSLAPTFNHNSDHTAFKVNITDTLSGSGTMLFDYLLGGSSRLKLFKDGRLTQTASVTDASDVNLIGSTQTWTPSSGTRTYTGLSLSITGADANLHANSRAMKVAHTQNIAANVTDGYAAGMTLAPTYNGDTATRTVTRHNYLELLNTVVDAEAAVTDACVMRFDAAAGTHKAVDGNTTKVTPGLVDAWVKVNINGTVYYLPAYTSKTA